MDQPERERARHAFVAAFDIDRGKIGPEIIAPTVATTDAEFGRLDTLWATAPPHRFPPIATGRLAGTGPHPHLPHVPLGHHRGGLFMFLRIDRLQVELPPPKKQDPNAAFALQELLGGKYGEMSTLGNYMFQSFNFRSKSKLKPFYELVAAITAEEVGHVELVSNGVAMLANGPDSAADDSGDGGDISDAPFESMKDIRLAAGFFSHGGGSVPIDSNGMSWNKDFVTTTGNVVFDLLHNFHLECGARLHKLRVYESLSASDATGREICGYLLVRGSVHAHAYALALKKLTGVSIEQMLPTPNIPLAKIPESQKYLAEGLHRRLYTFSPSDYHAIRGIWEGEQALPGDPPGELVVVEGAPEGGRIHDLVGQPSAFTPDYAPEEFYEIAMKLTQKAHQGAGSL